MVRFQALGGVIVTHEGVEVSVGGSRQRRLLAVLLINRNMVVSIDRLADAVFAGEPTPGASTTLRSYVARMRRVIEAGGDGPMVVTQAPGYLLRVDGDAFDVARFEAAVVEARALRSQGQPTEAIRVIRDALALWQGEAYAEFADEDWAWPETHRLAELRLVAHEILFDAHLDAGRAGDVIPEMEAMAAQHPMREAFVAQLMKALYRTGRQADALRAYRQHREVLVEELGLDPTPAMQALEQQVLDNDPGLLAEDGGQALRGYRLRERLGTGRDGTVHAATLPGVERDLVIRVYRADVADDPVFVRSFEATAHRLASLHHPAIVPIHDYWREPGAAYLALRRMHGGSLADRLERRNGRPLDATEASDITRRLEAALAAAHEVGVTHGRITPANVLFDDSGQAFLSDFDLRGLAHESMDRSALEALVRDCLGGVPELGPRPDGAPAPVNPYKGLRAFDEADADDFHGRSDLVDEMVCHVRRHDLRGRLLLVVGGSGTGKSSAVRAGLLPRVRRGDIEGSDRWFVTTMLPGATPFKELAAALRRVAVVDADGVVDELAAPGGVDRVVRRVLPDDGQLLLVVDQFEELFTSAPEPDQRRFLDGLMDAVTAHDSRVRVVATLRADFYDRPLAFQPFGGAVSDATVTIPAMTAAELESAIVEPAARAGRKVEGALLAELVSAAVNEPAGLPALQFTLFELAERCGGDLTLDAYRALGGLNGAIASRAEALYRSLDDDERAGVRRLFEQLVVVHPDGEPTRRRAARAEVTADDPALDPLVDRWADARLLSLDRHRQSRLPTVEPAHEALLREWPRLRRWIDRDRDALVLLGHLREAAAGWVALDRDAGALYRGARLQASLDALGTATLGAQEREFLDASVAARAAEETEAAAAVEQTFRANRRLRRQLVLIGVALVVALLGGLIAIDQRGVAVDERRVAFTRELAAAAEANLEEDPQRALLLALEAVEVGGGADADVRPEVVEVLHAATTRNRLLARIPDIGGAMDLARDGSVFITEGPEDSGLVDIRDAATGDSVLAFVGHEVDVNGVAFSHDGSQVATAGDDGAVRVWETATGDEVAEFSHPDGESARAPSFSRDGRLLALYWADIGLTQVVEISSGRLAAELGFPVGDQEFSADGRRLIAGANDEEGLLVLDVASGRTERWDLLTDSSVNDLALSPDGRLMASAHGDGSVRIWDAATGEPRITAYPHGADVMAVAWSPDGTRLATGSFDGDAKVHAVTDGGLREVLRLSSDDAGSGVTAVRFSPDGARLMTADWALAAVQIWDVSETGGAEWASWLAMPHRLEPSHFLPDDSFLVVQRDGRVSRRNAATGEVIERIEVGPDAVDGADFLPSPDGTLLALATGGHFEIRGLDGDLRASIDIAPNGFGTLAWTPDSQHLALAAEPGDRGLIRIVDRSGDTVTELVDETQTAVWDLAFTRDGDRLVTASTPPRIAPGQIGIQVWDWRSADVIAEHRALTEQLAMDPSRGRVATVSMISGDVDVIDLETGDVVFAVRGSAAALDVGYSPDGTMLAVGHADGTIAIWDAQDGRLVQRLRSPDPVAGTVAFSRDGRRLASVTWDGLVRVWALDTRDLVAMARQRLTRELTDAECRQYLRRETCDGD